MNHNEVTGKILEAGIEIHRELGPGLLESVYLNILAYELEKRGHKVQKEVDVPVVWDKLRFDIGFRADLIVDDLVIVELKSIEKLGCVDIHLA